MAVISELNEIDPLAISPKKARALLDVGLTRLYQLIGSGEIDSFRDGKSRKIVFASLKAYIARQIEAESTKPQKGWTHRATQARLAKKMLANVSLDVQRGVSKNCQRRREARNPHHK
jgi:excisionase family DNA binding protein